MLNFLDLINLFHANGLLQQSLKTSGNQRFADVFRGYRKRPVAARNRLPETKNGSNYIENVPPLVHF